MSTACHLPALKGSWSRRAPATSACSRRKLVPPTNRCPEPERSENLSVIPEFVSYEVRNGHGGLGVPERSEVQGTDVARRERREGYSIRASEPIAPVELLSILVTVDLRVEALTTSELRHKGQNAVQHTVLVHLLILSMGLAAEIQQRETALMLIRGEPLSSRFLLEEPSHRPEIMELSTLQV